MTRRHDDQDDDRRPRRRRPSGHLSFAAIAISATLLVACAGSDEPAADRTPDATPPAGLPDLADDEIRIRTDHPIGDLDPKMLGTNVAVWILPDVIGDERLHAVTRALGTGLLRFPGGSWSNDYQWAGCEIAEAGDCAVPWASNASDLAGLIAATELPAMWTVAFNRSAEEAAAAVAFFNGDVDDDRPIGVDDTGRDWGTVGSWARVRADAGHPEPVRVDYWEIGNEIYGAVAGARGDCASWGWENTWTCRPEDYVNGDAVHDGYLDFEAAIRAVDPSVNVGAIGIGARGEWSDWDDTVMSLAGDAIDFYAVHHYGSNGDLTAEELLEIPRRTWPRIADEVGSAADDHGLDSGLQLAVTEHNMVAFLDGDEERHMTSAANAFYLADTIGQFAVNDVALANQWLLVNGPLQNGTNYALIDPDAGMRRLPAYYGMALWARAGDELVATDVGDDLDDLRVYGVHDDGLPRLVVLNPTDRAVDTTIIDSEATGMISATADVVAAASLGAFDVTFNGSTDPNLELTEPAPAIVTGDDGTVAYTFAPFSITLLRWQP